MFSFLRKFFFKPIDTLGREQIVLRETSYTKLHAKVITDMWFAGETLIQFETLKVIRQFYRAHRDEVLSVNSIVLLVDIPANGRDGEVIVRVGLGETDPSNPSMEHRFRYYLMPTKPGWFGRIFKRA